MILMNMGNNVLVYAAAASTFVAGILHIALVPMFFKLMTPDVIIFFVVSGLAQIFWIIPTIKRWIMPWYYIGIGGTIILIILWIIAYLEAATRLVRQMWQLKFSRLFTSS